MMIYGIRIPVLMLPKHAQKWPKIEKYTNNINKLSPDAPSGGKFFALFYELLKILKKYVQPTFAERYCDSDFVTVLSQDPVIDFYEIVP